MLFTWGPEYEIQVETIDVQHRRMVDMINDYYRALTENRGAIPIQDYLSELGDYALNHFSEEEALMRDAGFPGMAAHLQEHEKLKSKVMELSDESAGFGKALSMRLAVFLREWLMKHIVASDMELGKFLNSPPGTRHAPATCDTCGHS